jgi:hypothetical protein
LRKTVKREVFEETRMTVSTKHIIFIEDLIVTHYRKIKIWFFCEFVKGTLKHNTHEALKEGIVNVGWFTKEELHQETVYPEIVKEKDWSILKSTHQQEISYNGPETANF